MPISARKLLKDRETFPSAHADYAYQHKYGHRDYRGGGRSSAETAMRVAAGAIAKVALKELFGVKVRGCLTRIGDIECQVKDWSIVNENPFSGADPDAIPALEALMTDIRREKDSIGAELMVVADGVPPGWGEPVFDRLDADLAHALMGINAVKGVSIGDGFDVVSQKGSQHRDEMTPTGFKSNHAVWRVGRHQFRPARSGSPGA